MRFTDFLADLVDFGKRDESGNILVKDGMQGTAISRLNVEEIALFSVIDLVASTAAMCEWRTYQNGQYQRGDDWFRWNVEPNQNENAFSSAACCLPGCCGLMKRWYSSGQTAACTLRTVSARGICL